MALLARCVCRSSDLHLSQHTIALALYVQHLYKTGRRKELHRANLAEGVTDEAEQVPDSIHPFRGKRCGLLLKLLIAMSLPAAALYCML